MIITCPYCGPRDSGEFVYREEGGRTRPDDREGPRQRRHAPTHPQCEWRLGTEIVQPSGPFGI